MKNAFIIFLFGLFAFAANAQTDPTPQTPATTDVKQRAGAVLLTPAQVDSLRAADLKKLAMTKVKVDTAAVLPFGVDYSKPETFFQEGFLGTLKAGFLALFIAVALAFKSLRPLLERKGAKFAASAAVALVALTSTVAFREGVFTENFVQMLLKEFLPNFAYSGLVFNAIKFILGLIGKKKTDTETAKGI